MKKIESDVSIGVVGSLLGVTIICGMLLSSVFATADSGTVDDIAINVPVACTLTGAVIDAHTATMNAGHLETDIGTTNLKAVCNDPNGFSIYAIGFTNDTPGNNKLVSSNAEINTGTTTSGNSTWAMKLSTDSTATYPITLESDFNDQYASVPSSYTKVASRLTATDSGTGAVGANLTTTYQVYASTTQLAGNYTGKVKYTLLHPYSETPGQPQPSSKNYISYYANNSSATGTVGNQYIATGNTPALTAGNFSKTGYGFAGWNDVYDYSGTFYGTNETINVTEEMANNGLSLYAVWVESEGYLQDAGTVSSVCSSLTTASASGINDLRSVAALTDRRDGNTYAIAKLADGNCWMIENMRLNSSTALSSSDTNNPFVSNGLVSITNDDGTVTNHLSSSSSGWCLDDNTACIDQSKLNSDNVDNYLSNTTGSKTSDMYGYGNYYNWYSATAGQGLRFVITGSNSPGDICPSGWRLPTGGSNSELTNINDVVNGSSTTTSAGLRTFPNNFVFAGRVNLTNGEVSDRSWYGNYWSATAVAGGAYGLRISDGAGGTDPTNVPWRYTGHSIRCIADLP